MVKQVKLHLGCGEVYLKGWTNIDIDPNAIIANVSEEDGIYRYNATDLNHYYNYRYGGCSPYGILADIVCDIRDLPYSPLSVDKILAVQTLEHLPEKDVVHAIESWYEILKPGGLLYIDVPDLVGTLRLLEKHNCIDKERWIINLLYGSQRSEYSYHQFGFTRKLLKQICLDAGFSGCAEVALIRHEYPTFTIGCFKGE